MKNSATRTLSFPILRGHDDAGYPADRPETIGKLARVSRTTARRLYEQGADIIVVGHRMLPYPHVASTTAVSLHTSPDADFDQLVQMYTSRNCSWETGYYPAFWTRFDTYHTFSHSATEQPYQGVVAVPA